MKKLLSLLLLACLLAGCGAPPSSAGALPQSTASPSAVVFTDALGREVTVDRPRRVAALIGSFADIWCLAGGKDTLVAAANDTWTSFDLGLGDAVADLGAIKEPNLEVLLAVQPDLVLASSNTAADVALCDVFEQTGITAAYFDVQTFDDYLNMLEICTRITGCAENYDQYGTAVQSRVEQALARQDGTRPTVLCIRATGASCKVKGSADNVLGEMLAGLGCVNVADGDAALLENLSLEAILAADPDYIFAVLQGADPTDAQKTLDAALLTNPAWSSLRAVQEGRFYTLDHKLFNLKPNARWGEAYEILADILYPG